MKSCVECDAPLEGGNGAWLLQMIDLRKHRTYEEWRSWDYLRDLQDEDFLEIEIAFNGHNSLI